MPSITLSTFSGANWDQILALYQVVIPKRGEVQSYLQDHSDLAEVLLPLCMQTRQEFGDRAELCLEIYHDSESQDHYLTLYVRQVVYEPDILARIEKICGPFEEQLGERSGWLLVTTDFRPPGWKNGF